MKVNKKTDLAIRILKYLIAENDGQFHSGSELSTTLNVSYNHLRRVTPILNELGYTNSKLGKDGGIKLTADAFNIPLSKLMLLTELDEHCINDCDNCPFNSNCQFEIHSRKALAAFCHYFDDVYLSDL